MSYWKELQDQALLLQQQQHTIQQQRQQLEMLKVQLDTLKAERSRVIEALEDVFGGELLFVDDPVECIKSLGFHWSA